MTTVSEWIDNSPYTVALGIVAKSVEESKVALALPFRETNSNPGGALHGGVAASLSVVGAQAVARGALGEGSGPWHTVAFQINYLAAAISEGVEAEARLLRRGKELCFVEVSVKTEEGKPIADAAVAVRGRQGRPPIETALSKGDDGVEDPGVIGGRIGAVSFIGNRGISVELMLDGRSRLRMPWKQENGDLDGGTHEGAALALLDTAGAMAAWSVTGPGRFKASTPTIQAHVLAPPPAHDLVAYATVTQRDEEIFWTEVEVASAVDGRVYLRGMEVYRIVT